MFKSTSALIATSTTGRLIVHGMFPSNLKRLTRILMTHNSHYYAQLADLLDEIFQPGHFQAYNVSYQKMSAENMCRRPKLYESSMSAKARCRDGICIKRLLSLSGWTGSGSITLVHDTNWGRREESKIWYTWDKYQTFQPVRSYSNKIQRCTELACQ